MGEVVTVKVRWNGKNYDVPVESEGKLSDLKEALNEVTGVRPHRQKLVELGNKLSDDAPLSSLNLKKPLMLIGSLEEDIEKVESAENGARIYTVIDDFDVDYSDEGDRDQTKRFVLNMDNVRSKLNRRLMSTRINFTNPVRPGKRLLVLDVDYTIMDHKTAANSVSELMRPGLHTFLEKVYEYYDICVWSQSTWRWLELKITELGLLTHSAYKLSFVLDRTSMFSVISRDRRSGKERKHEVKPLPLIWHKVPQFNERNTVHVDDLSRNFALNPKNGLKISAFKNAPLGRFFDRELYDIADYLVHLALNETDFTRVDHRDWRSVVHQIRQER
mmetsp:Transcript_12143/g.37007  ORF Transcript_12143/g.37007 Transcript_12143/m.37007 type:complete len:331 (-) Transcript_12143:1540-2532(-)|eukprot:CAMPEP_0198731702 /NCGR_PEP_ID=MMETSP1475-20131203/31574_1 /TAXON_ID= ORGANISM="Unidentified sp., Strain CCMP1999" /NCGR_SAMPLE_ID=MMETSP1475 /ASSEMBLY_ACC=CAM_ASM_001111 /LENGTH=330 /DNA_ID=CAMNT_0044494701 /DNA_START=252 /DNA_END=1244 /DNA_ORIENTATION=-